MFTCFSGSSHSALLHTSLTWSINHFSFRDTRVRSPAFYDEKKTAFFLDLYPTGRWSNNKQFVSLDITMAAKQSVKIKCKLSLTSLHGQKRLLYDETESLNLLGNAPNWVEMNILKVISREALLEPSNGNLPNDTLTLHCEIVHLGNGKTYLTRIVPSQAETMAKVFGTLRNDYGSLLKSGNLADVKLIVGGKTIPAHKSILSARSSVFAAMFSHETKEKMENIVEILDIKPEVFEVFLSFLYTGAMPTLDNVKSAQDLLIAADKYDCGQLKTVCEDYLISQLTIETAPNLLLLANSVNSPKVKESSLEFIRSRGSELFDALKNNTEQMINLFQILAEKDESSSKGKTSQESESMNVTEDTAKCEKRKLLEN